MTTRRGEPIEMERGDKGAATPATPEGRSVEEILRPLAESDDGRFEALRRLHPHVMGEAVIWGCDCPGWLVDASLGAIVRAAAACGQRLMFSYFLPFKIGNSRAVWECAIVLPTDDVPPVLRTISWTAQTPEEAAALVLVAAAGDEKLHHATEPKHG